MKKTITIFMMLLIASISYSQSIDTPNSGINWNLSELMQNSNGGIVQNNGIYIIHQPLNIHPNDTIIMNGGDIMAIDSGLKVTVEGTLFMNGNSNDSIYISATDTTKPFAGFRFENTAHTVITYTNIEFGGGLKVITTDFEITHSSLKNNAKGVATAAVIDLSYGSPLIQNNRFEYNDNPAIASPANREVSAKIIDNYIAYNSQLNQNRPQINMGTTKEDDTLIIAGNIILGDRNLTMVGGIAVSNLLGTGKILSRIENNTITDNRYGITVVGGNSNVEIIGNIIEDNDTQNNPSAGGSGISLSSSSNTQNITAHDNEIRRNLWGITIINKASIDLGSTSNPGRNIFSDNGNNGTTYALYNNTQNTISAQHNCWVEGRAVTLQDADSVIFDLADDSTLGQVIYDPVGCSDLSIEDMNPDLFVFYPNPASDQLQVNLSQNEGQLDILSLEGNLILTQKLSQGINTINLALKSGIYLIQVINKDKRISDKLIIQ